MCSSLSMVGRTRRTEPEQSDEYTLRLSAAFMASDLQTHTFPWRYKIWVAQSPGTRHTFCVMLHEGLGAKVSDQQLAGATLQHNMWPLQVRKAWVQAPFGAPHSCILRFAASFRSSALRLFNWPAPFGAQLFFLIFFFLFFKFCLALLGTPRISGQAPFGAQAPASRKKKTKT